MDSTPPRFLCDHMLGSLAKWLRLLGYDTVYPGPLEDREMAAMAYDEGRVLLTRDKDLAARVKGSVFVGSDDIDEQLKSVIGTLHLNLSNTLSRCSVCNMPIVGVDRVEVEHEVPPKVLEIHDEFWKCPSCFRVYWRGTHWDQMMQKIRRLQDRA